MKGNGDAARDGHRGPPWGGEGRGAEPREAGGRAGHGEPGGGLSCTAECGQSGAHSEAPRRDRVGGAGGEVGAGAHSHLPHPHTPDTPGPPAP